MRTGAINLGQGFPDTDGPTEVSEAAIEAIRSGHNQYPPGPGIPELRTAIAAHQQRFYGLDYDPDTEVLVTAGATEALAGAIIGLCEVGDEVVTFEPYYDSYTANIAMAGAVPKLYTLHPPEHGIDLDELAALITPKTRLVLVNTPHNPTGKVFSADELAGIAELCVAHDLIAVTDEVYEHLVFDGTHQPLATFPGMRERTVTISSGGKSFSFTGWKIGWACAPPPLLAAVRTAKQFLTYVNGAPLQHGIAAGLGLPDEYFERFQDDLRIKRDRLDEGLRAAGFEVFPTQGTYFITTDIRALGESDGMAFCRSLPERCGVVAVPSVVFYDNTAAGRHLVRFTFCKRLEVLDDAATRLKSLSV